MGCLIEGNSTLLAQYSQSRFSIFGCVVVLPAIFPSFLPIDSPPIMKGRRMNDMQSSSPILSGSDQSNLILHSSRYRCDLLSRGASYFAGSALHGQRSLDENILIKWYRYRTVTVGPWNTICSSTLTHDSDMLKITEAKDNLDNAIMTRRI
jgi:hypothetical protein